MRTTIFGHVCIDHNQSESATYTAAGSPAVFISKIYRLYDNCDATIIAPYGSDFIPFSKDLTLLPSKPDEEKTLVYQNISSFGKRSQKAFNRKSEFSFNLSDEIKKVLKSSDVVMVAPLLPYLTGSYLKGVLSNAQQSLKVLLPQGYFRDFDDRDQVIPRQFNEWSEIIPQFDIVTVSIEDKPNIEQDINEWIKRYPKITVVMTMAEKGAKIFSNNRSQQVFTIPIPEHEIVDSVGSGDIFTAAFTYNYHQHKDVIKATKYANDVAARCLKFNVDDLYKAFPKK